MSRADYADVDKLTNEQKVQLDRVPLNLTRMLLHCPAEMVKSFYDLAWSFRSGILDPRIREGIILRVAALRGNGYELEHHVPAAKEAGLNDDEIAAITSDIPGKSAALAASFISMLNLVDDCVKQGKATDATFENASRFFSTSEIAEATLLAGLYSMCACFIETMGVGLDQHPLNWAWIDKPGQ
ncbi:MAG: carboxymuconolactone decarboxylase family protein [Verrucomicrobiota bacterium]